MTNNNRKNILVLGAGKSATALIKYLLDNAAQNNWTLTLGDYDTALATRKINDHKYGKAVFFDVNDAHLRSNLVAKADLVISILPADFHYLVALDCLQHHKHLITPSYVAPREQALDTQFKEKGLLMMCEMGLDPGIDHMSLMKTLHDLRNKGAIITALRSFCGALIAPESDDNPWNYKFTWAPMNVILAGSGGTAQYLKNNKPKYIPYSRLFAITEIHPIEGYGEFEAYANRDSLPYIHKYGIEDIPTFVRGTLRRHGFCTAWNALVKLGLTDNQLLIDPAAKFTYHQLIVSFLPPLSIEEEDLTIQEQLASFLEIDSDNEIITKIQWLGLFANKLIPMNKPLTPAQILLALLEQKWELHPNDKDMIVMLHRFDYELQGKSKVLTATMVVKGTDPDHTAIAATVGLPMGIFAKMLLNNSIKLSGVQIPIMPQVYEPILAELEQQGIVFIETEVE